MEELPVKTLDNSLTLYSKKYNEHYHSINGALTESIHIFINLGLELFSATKINILEIGYGTGLNALLTFKRNIDLKNHIFYHGVDVNPVTIDLAFQLKLDTYLLDNMDTFNCFYESWDLPLNVSESFTLLKEKNEIQNIDLKNDYNLVYYDAFSPETQPEMWTEELFSKIYRRMSNGGVLVTYCSKGIVKQNLRNAGFDVKRLAGPPGKRHVIRATKL